MTRNVKWSLAAAAGGLVLILVLLVIELGRDGTARPAGQVDIGGPFELVDQTGAVRRDSDFAGRPMLVFFGFTYCPDVCPMSLDTLGAALQQLQTEAPDLYAALQPLFISVDPARDTPAQMADYLSYFHPNIIGLTGSVAQIDAVKKAYRVYAARAPEADANGNYTVDHSSLFYLMDENGDYLAHFDHGQTAAALAAGLKQKLSGRR